MPPLPPVPELLGVAVSSAGCFFCMVQHAKNRTLVNCGKLEASPVSLLANFKGIHRIAGAAGKALPQQFANCFGYHFDQVNLQDGAWLKQALVVCRGSCCFST